MTRTVTALYDTKAEAEAARERLSQQVDVEGRAKIIDQSSGGSGAGRSDIHSVPLSRDDRPTYEEGLRRGGFMLCAEVDDDEDTDKIVSILEQTSSVDLEDRERTWRADGWAPDGERSVGTEGSKENRPGGEGLGSRLIEEERIPIVEEQLRVGKREFERGGARVRSYVEERPVEESVTLREEHVEVERRPLNQPLSSGDLENDDLLRERTVEMRETAEEPVVAKEARVTEEVVIQKSATERTEQVRDTLRNTNVEIDEGSSPTRDQDGPGTDRDESSGGDR